jgi:hypothetical protein
MATTPSSPHEDQTPRQAKPVPLKAQSRRSITKVALRPPALSVPVGVRPQRAGRRPPPLKPGKRPKHTNPRRGFGRLQHVARIFPAAKAFFTPVNNALRGAPVFVGLSRHGEVRKALLDFGVLIRDLTSWPTHVSELVQNPLDYVGYCDASSWGVGGGMVWRSARPQTHSMEGRVASGHHQLPHVDVQPLRDHHQLRLGDGRGTTPRISTRGKAGGQGHGTRSDGYRMRQFAGRRMDHPDGDACRPRRFAYSGA